MGIFDSLSRSFGFAGGGNTGARAAEERIAFNQKGIDRLEEGFDTTREVLDPFLEAGLGGLDLFSQGASVGGFDEILSEIFNTDIFDSLVSERTDSIRGQLAAGGLTRSGTALEEIARVPTDVGLNLGRDILTRAGDLAGRGQNAASGIASNAASFAQQIARLFQDSGVAKSGGIVTDRQAQAQADQNLLNTFQAGATAGSFFLPGGGGIEALGKSITGGSFF